jgi:hypothetical protein
MMRLNGDGGVRTTLAIDDDVLEAARSLARGRQSTVGEVISELARVALATPSRELTMRNGIPLLPGRKGAPLVTMELVNRLRDDED